MPFEEVRKICHDYTVAGLDAIFEVRDKSTPLRFCYMSGEASERDQNAKPTWMPEYTLLRVCCSSLYFICLRFPPLALVNSSHPAPPSLGGFN